MKEEDIDKRIERVIESVGSKKAAMRQWETDRIATNEHRKIVAKRWRIYGISAAASLIVICGIGIGTLLKEGGRNVHGVSSPEYTSTATLYRGGVADLSEISAMIDSAQYDEALKAINVSMADTTVDLSFTPERQQYLRDLNKSRIYELKWMKIDVLIKSGRKNEALKQLESFVKEEGAHQSEAKNLLKSLHE